jgi:hypothetical protein
LTGINPRSRAAAMLEAPEGGAMSKRHLYPCVLSIALWPAAAAAQPLPMNEQGGVRWVCGGIGETERAELASMEAQANLKLVFAAGKRGEYLADVAVVLADREGKRPALKFTAGGPICLVQAPAGRYQVEAAYRNEKRSIATSAAKDARQPGMLVFRFPAEE